MFIGGYVSASGVGLTCPKWPLCPKGLIPMKEFIIEYFHRTVAITTSVLILLTMISIMKSRSALPRSIQISSVIATILALAQVSLGGIVIVEKLHAILVTVHLAVGLALFSMTLMTVLYAYEVIKPDPIISSSTSPSRTGKILNSRDNSSGHG
jgi:heme A synthase